VKEKKDREREKLDSIRKQASAPGESNPILLVKREEIRKFEIPRRSQGLFQPQKQKKQPFKPLQLAAGPQKTHFASRFNCVGLRHSLDGVGGGHPPSYKSHHWQLKYKGAEGVSSIVLQLVAC